jgi:predicted unusual protein kinase regulating ubiquinone biosynthesis (AarF/ABC1/UbiB family)
MRRQRFTTTIKTITRVFWHFITRDEGAMYTSLYDGFNELGGVYVKFLQVLTIRSSSLKKSDLHHRLAVFDDVEADELDLDFVLNHELGEKLAQFASVSREPFAAGSFGQVYHATLQNGQPVIIKVLRPSLLRYLSFDLKLLRVLSFIIKLVSPKMIYDIDQVFRDFREVVNEETDYIKEAKSAHMFWRRYDDHPHIEIPRTYMDLSTKYMITQDYLGGVAATKLIEWKAEGHDIEAYVRDNYQADLELLTKVLGYDLLYSSLSSDIVQGDPHPGNIKILPGNKIGLIDFGITAPPPDNRYAFMELMKDFVALYHGEYDIGKVFMDGLFFYTPDLYQAINTVNQVYSRSKDKDIDIEAEISKAATNAFIQNSRTIDVRQELFRGNIAQFFEKTINEGNRFGLNINFDGSVLMRAAATYMSIVDGFGYREEVIPGVFEDVISDVEQSGITLESKPETTDVGRAIEILSDWLEDITDRDPFLFRDLIVKMRGRLKDNV